MAQEVAATDGAARSVKGAQGGLCKTGVDTTGVAMTITAWKGRYVTISVVGQAGYYNFSDAAAMGGLDPTAESVDAATPNVEVPGVLLAGTSVRVLVPDYGEAKAVYLLVAAQASTAAFRVHKS